MKRGTFDQTSQICRTTVRLGRLRTFSHYLERDSMERQWLREQVGGRIASQDRLRAERSALSLMRSSARARGAAEHAAAASSPAAPSGWKAWKRSARKTSGSKGKRKTRSMSKARPASRFAVARSFLRALFGRSTARSSSTPPLDAQLSRRASIKRCPRCGKIAKRKAGPDPNRSEDVVQEERANADRLLSDLPLPSEPTISAFQHNATPGTNSTSSRRPHIYSMLDTSRSGMSHRTIPSTYTHVCRRKSKSSNEWHNIKFMVRIQAQALFVGSTECC